MQQTCPISLIIPVRIRMSVRIRAIFKHPDVLVTITSRLETIPQTCVIGWADTINHGSSFRGTHISVIRNTRSTRLTTFCRDQDNTIRSLRTVNSGGRSVFQYRNTLNIIRIDIIHRATLDTIDQDIWAGRVQSTDTTDTDRTTILSRTALTRGNGYTRHHTLKTGRHVGDRTACQLLAIQLGYRSRQVRLLLRTITDNDHLI